jgi:lipoteichoic acid synthase
MKTFFQKNAIFLLLVIIAAAGISAPHWYKPNPVRWRRAQPVFFTFYDEVRYDFAHNGKPSDYNIGIAFLGGDTLSEAPFFHKAPDEDSSIAAFQARPMRDKPDIILFTLESLRGWTADIRIGRSCAHFKNLCRLARMGTFFPYGNSVGFPSTEGHTGIQLGIWSHPEKVLATEPYTLLTRSLPDILGKAGYYRVVLDATDPAYDNLMPWFEDWYDTVAFQKSINTDCGISREFNKIYAARPQDRPLFLNWVNVTTHISWLMPPEAHAGPDPADLDDRYWRVTAYMDSAIGMVLDEVEKGDRAKNTIFIAVGDHAMPTGKQTAIQEFTGTASSPDSWTGMWWAGPGIRYGYMDTRPVSQADIAPTLLSLLHLHASNHFVGSDLFGNADSHPVFTIRLREMARLTDRSRLQADMGDSTFAVKYRMSEIPDWDTTHLVNGFITEPQEPVLAVDRDTLRMMRAGLRAWEYVLDNDLLMPKNLSEKKVTK